MPKSPKTKHLFKDILIVLVLTLVLACTLEGLASFSLIYTGLDAIRIPAERLHTEYDPELGWINKRSVHIPDMYGPNVYVKTNSQRFRNNHNFSAALPDGQKRWICSGDSFTFGYGVDNDNTWCAHLAAADPDVETVNMGQGGYGLDQAYLWYMRDGTSLAHDVLILAFITEDIPRMGMREYMKFPKPHLMVKDGLIVNQSEPLPRPGFLTAYLPRYYPLINRLNVVQLWERIMTDVKEPDESGKDRYSQKELVELTLTIFTTLHDHGRKYGREVFFVHLPVADDYRQSARLDQVRAFLQSQALRNRWNYIDLIADFRKLNIEDADNLFIRQDLKNYAYSRGHYSINGNRYIAGLLADRIKRHLQEIPGRQHSE